MVVASDRSGPSRRPWGLALSPAFSSSRRRCWTSASPPGSSVRVRFGSSSFLSSGALLWWVHIWWSCPSSCELTVCLAGRSRFRARRGFAVCLLLTGTPGFRSLFVLLRPLSLSLFLSFFLSCSTALLCSSPSSIWGLALSAAVSDLLGPPCLLVLSCQAPVCVPQDPRGLASSRRSLPPSRWGPALLLSRGAHPVHSSGSVQGFGWSSWLSTLPASWFWFLQLSQFPVVWRGASAVILSGSTLSLSSAPWLFHRILPPVSSVLPLLGSRLLCSLAGWLVLCSAFQVLVEAGPSSSACVVSSAPSSCLRWALRYRLLLLHSRVAPCVFFLEGFPSLQQVLLFSLILQAFLFVSLHPVSV